MKLALPSFQPKLGVFSLGIAPSLYYIAQYLTVPLFYWTMGETTNSVFAVELFDRYESIGMEIITPEVYVYLVLGFVALVAGYGLFRDRQFGTNLPNWFHEKWSGDKTLLGVFLLLCGGFALKAAKLYLGNGAGYFGIPDLEYNAYTTLWGDSTLGFMLSYNWLHLIALGVVLVAYFEAEKQSHSPRLFYFAYGIFLFLLFTPSNAASPPLNLPLWQRGIEGDFLIGQIPPPSPPFTKGGLRGIYSGSRR